MTRDNALRLFNFSHTTVKLNIMGITEAESLMSPLAGINSMHWILGHIVATRRSLLKMMDAEMHWTEEDAEAFSKPPQETIGITPKGWPEIVEGLEDSQRRIEAAIERFHLLDEFAPGNKILADEETYGDRFGFFFGHETYHAGQLGTLRRLLGKPGQI
jgi:uncharacterized damage-inducible protein DinB